MTRRFIPAALLALSLSILAVLSLSACGSEKKSEPGAKAAPAVYTEADNYSTVNAAVGDTIMLSLNQSPKLDEIWRLKPSSGLKIVDTESSTAVIGIDRAATVGVKVWTIEVTAAGTQEIEGFYGNPKKPAPTLPNYLLTIEVK